MVSELLTSWLTKLDGRFVREKRIAMVVDSCPAHPNIQSNLKAITLVFLPPNTTSKSQPCDQSIIHNLKLHYRKHLIMQLLTSRDRFSIQPLGCPLPASPLQAQCITLCNFRHCGSVAPEDNPQNKAGNEVDTDLEETSELLVRVKDSVNIGDYLNADQEVAVHLIAL